MKNIEKISYGLLITIIIFIIANYFSVSVHLNLEQVPNSFVLHSTMLILSIFFISIFRKNLNYKISLPRFQKILKPILFGVLVSIIANIALSIITKVAGGDIQGNPIALKMNAFQVFIFIFIYASIAEEMLFRGFLLNLLEPLKSKGFYLLKRKISLSVIISALTFGLSHLILITTGVNSAFLIRVVIFTTLLGIVAGYYQEKYDNNAYAIIVHMAGNSIGVIGVLLMSPDA
jgi:membrane protease YdiL (CAAX protease family)